MAIPRHFLAPPDTNRYAARMAGTDRDRELRQQLDELRWSRLVGELERLVDAINSNSDDLGSLRTEVSLLASRMEDGPLSRLSKTYAAMDWKGKGITAAVMLIPLILLYSAYSGESFSAIVRAFGEGIGGGYAEIFVNSPAAEEGKAP